MNKYKDQRSCNRNRPQQAAFFSRWGEKNCYDTTILNCSEDGVCFTASVPYLPETEIAIKIMAGDEESLVSVVWCEPILIDGKENFYKIGAKYFEPV